MQTIRLVIVEDNYLLRYDLQRQIEKYPELQLVGSFADGLDFWQALQKGTISPPDVVLMDIEMPIMNGIEATKKCKSLFPQVEIVMLTVFNQEQKIFEALQAGAVGYLLKDEKIEKIVEAVLDVHKGGSILSPTIARKVLQAFDSQAIMNNKMQTSASSKEVSSDNLLTKREMEILKYVIEGITYSQIAEKLFISYGTVRTHVRNIFEKLQVSNKQEATKLAIKKKWFL